MARIELKPEGSDALIVVEYEPRNDGKRRARSVRINGRAVECSLVMESVESGWMVVNGRVAPFHIHRDGAGRIEVWFGGRTFRIEAARKGRTRGGGSAAALSSINGEIRAPMPGTILAVHVTNGMAVKADQALIVMESMKMEMSLAASGAGRVEEVLCRAGQLVEMNALLMRISEREAS